MCNKSQEGLKHGSVTRPEAGRSKVCNKSQEGLKQGSVAGLEAGRNSPGKVCNKEDLKEGLCSRKSAMIDQGNESDEEVYESLLEDIDALKKMIEEICWTAKDAVKDGMEKKGKSSVEFGVDQALETNELIDQVTNNLGKTKNQ